MSWKVLKKTSYIIIPIIVILIFSISIYADEPSIDKWAEDGVYNSLFYEVAYTEFFENYKSNITRQEFAMIAVNVYRIAKGRELDEVYEYTFDDIDNAKYKDEVQIAYNLGIVKGYSNRVFGPDDLVSRQQICVMIYRLLQIIEPDEDYSNVEYNDFVDKENIANWAVKEVNYIYNEKIMNGTGVMQISPTAYTTRQQGLTLLYRLILNKKYISGLSEELIEKYNLEYNASYIENLYELDDYLRDSVISRKREIRILKDSNVTIDNISNVLSEVDSDFRDIGYFYVPEILSYKLTENDNYYNLSIRYQNYDKEFVVYSQIDSTSDFEEELLIQVRTGNDEKAYKINVERLRDSNVLMSKIEEVLYKHPELNYVKKYGYTNNPEDPDVWNIKFEFVYTEEKTREVIAKTLEFAKNISKDIIKTGMSMTQKEKSIHDYIIKKVAYSTDPNINDYVFYENGVLLYGEAVCQGYASTMKLLLGLNGINSIGIKGYAQDGEGHAWNLVKIYGSWYHVDTTWNDPVPDKIGVVQYDYFNLPDDIISTNHSWDRKAYANATSMTHNYYYERSLYFSNAEDVEEFLTSQILNNKTDISFMIENYDSTTYDISEIIKSAFAATEYNSYSYEKSINENIGIVKIKISY